MRFSEASGHKIVSTSSAETVGRVDGFVVDPAARSVVAVLVKKSDGNTLRWNDITAFGTDAVTVTGPDKIVEGGGELEPLLGKHNHMLRKRVLSTTGDQLGSVKDVDFDPSSGAVTALILDTGEIPGKRLTGVGSYAVVVQAD
jgi:sporulation protein YlmC with PRC-barrel domain